MSRDWSNITYMHVLLFGLGLILVSASICVHAEVKGETKRSYFFKPLTTILIISSAFYIYAHGPLYSPAYSGKIMIGLIFCLGGDIALMFRQKIYFATGLTLFLIGHLIFIYAFLGHGILNRIQSTLPGTFFPATGYILAAVFMLLTASLLFLLMLPGLGRMKIPVILYMIVISLMLYSALLCFAADRMSKSQAGFIFTGAVLFYISDTILGIARFKKAFPLHRLSLFAYWGGLSCIMLSTLR